MRKLGSCLFAAYLLLLSGCAWLNGKKNDDPSKQGRTQAKAPPTAAGLVAYLNREADQMSNLTSDKILLTAYVNGERQPGLTAFMVCEKPRNFRLTGDAAGSTWVDIGSNGDKFWFWMKNEALYHCSYTDYEKGVKLPLPFQPEWVIQALGMAKYDPQKKYEVKSVGTTTELIEETTVQGRPVRKITVFAMGHVEPTYPRVTAHIVQDVQTGKTICQANIRRVRQAMGKGSSAITYPSSVELEWPAEQLKMTMTIDGATLNEAIAANAGRRYFTMPTMPGIRTVDLADLRSSGAGPADIRQAGGRQ